MDKRTTALLASVGALAALGGLGLGALLWSGTEAVEHAGEEGEHDGEEHEEGEAGFVALSPAEARAAGVQVTTVTAGGGAELILAGRVGFAPNAEASIGAPLAGLVEGIHVTPGTRVGLGTPLATLRSGEGASLNASVGAARAELDAARAAYARETRLYEAKVTARQDWEAARAVVLKSEAALRAAQAQVAAAGSPGTSGRITVRAPIAGTVTSLAAAPGAVLAQGAPIAQLANDERIEIVFDAPAATSRAIRIGSVIRASLASGEAVSAVVTAMAPGAEGGGVHIRARPVGFVPPAGTPLSGRVTLGGQGGLSVPTEAVQTLEGRKVVFVSEARGFRAQPVQTGAVGGDRTEILSGLTIGQRIAGKGAFLLKAELSRGEAEHEH